MNLLIIDDDAICSFVNKRVAQTTGIFSNIHSVHNGKDALEFFQEVCNGTVPAPDVVLLDLNMPVLSGFDFINALRSLSFDKKEDMHIVILTSSDDANDIDQARAMGIANYMLKPLTVNELQATIFSFEKKVSC